MGIALMIEAARVLAADPPRRSVLFIAVGGEERGLLGSDYYAHNPSVPIEQLVGLVNLDMPLFLYPLASVIGFGAEHSTMGPAIEAAVAEAGLFLAEDPLKDEVLFIRSDQYSFVKQGVPSVSLVPGFVGRAVYRDRADVLLMLVVNLNPKSYGKRFSGRKRGPKHGEHDYLDNLDAILAIQEHLLELAEEEDDIPIIDNDVFEESVQAIIRYVVKTLKSRHGLDVQELL